MIFLGGLALFLCVYALGCFWPPRNNHTLGVGLWGYFVKSLFISWILFIVSFHTSAGDAAPALTIIFMIGWLGLLATGKVCLRTPVCVSAPSARTRNFGFSLAMLLIATPALASIGSIFTEWDAVVSWNRWAAEFTENRYGPIGGAYPVLWPAVWSLVYEAQGTTQIWYVAKAAAITPVLFTAVYLADKMRTGPFLSAACVCAFAWFIFVIDSRHLTSGYMDIPVALFGLVAIVLLLDFVDEVDSDRRGELFFFAALTASLAMVTKQAGAFFVLFFIGFAATALWRKTINASDIVKSSVVLAVPIGTFLWLYLQRRESVIGNIDVLMALAERARSDTDPILHALLVLNDAAPVPVLLLLLLCAGLNFLFLRSPRTAFGFAALGFAGVGFFIYKDCCSYDIRNGLWVYSFLIASAYAGLKSAESKFRSIEVVNFRGDMSEASVSPRLQLIVVGVLAITLIAAVSALPYDSMLMKHREQQARLVGSEAANAFLSLNKDELAKHGRIISYYQPLRYIPDMGEKFTNCPQTTQQCVLRQFKDSDVNSVIVFTPGWNENEKSRTFLENAIASRQAMVVQDDNRRRLIVFERDDWDTESLE